MEQAIWPLMGLEVVTPTLALRYITDELGVELALLAAEGVHDRPEGIGGFEPSGESGLVSSADRHCRCRFVTFVACLSAGFAAHLAGCARWACTWCGARSIGVGFWVGVWPASSVSC